MTRSIPSSRPPIIEYVADLGLERVTQRQKALLMVIAGWYVERYHSSHLDLSTLAFELLVKQRWVRRMIAAVEEKGILDHTPGHGPGSVTCFRFPEFETQRKSEAVA